MSTNAEESTPPIGDLPEHTLVDLLSKLARGTDTDLDAYIHDVESHFTIDGTRISTHCHCLKNDGNGRPRLRAFIKAAASHILDYAIPRSAISEAHAVFSSTGSTAKLMELGNQAKELFTDLLKTGEGGELLLFVMAEALLGLPQAICKMDLKTHGRMHIHGADGLHLGAREDGQGLALYWGESKVFGDFAGAVYDCLKSLAPYLTAEQDGRDLQLLQRYSDLDNPTIEEAFKRFIDPDDPAFCQLEYRGICLIGFTADCYPQIPGSETFEAIVAKALADLPSWRDRIQARATEEKLVAPAIAIHFFLLPLPSVDRFRTTFREALGIHIDPEDDK